MVGNPSTPTSSSADDHDLDNAPLKHEGWQSIEEKPRICTDVFFLLLLFSSWLAMTMVGFAVSGVYPSNSLKQGNLDQLLYPSDYDGRICGVHGEVSSRPYGYFLIDGSVVCVSSCPSITNYDEVTCRYEYQDAADSSASVRATYIQEYKCLFDIKSISVINRCLPQISLSSIESALASQYNVTTSFSISSSGSWFESFMGDVYKLRGIVFGFGLGVSTLVAFGYLYLLRIPGLLYIMLWSIIIAVQVCLIVVSFLLWSLATKWKQDGDHKPYEVTGIRLLGFIGMGLSLLYFCLMLAMRKRVKLAIGVVKETARALATMPALICLPILQVIGITIFLVPWIIYVLFLASSGDVQTITKDFIITGGVTVSYSYKTYEFAQNTRYAFIYMIFCYFWTSEFILAVGQMTLSLSMVAWYFTRNKKHIGNHTMLWGLRTSIVYHAGTAAFGSLIMAVILTIRTIISYYQKQTKKMNSSIIKYTLCVAQCCLCCIERVMRFINKNAYIQTAIYGYSFFKAARTAFFLILRNILRIFAVNMVADFMLFIGKVFVVAVTVFICYLVLGYGIDRNEVNGIMSPLIFVGILSYYVAAMFSEIFSMSIESILCCYIADEEMFALADRFADGALKATIQNTTQAASNKKIGHEPHIVVVGKAHDVDEDAKDGGIL